MPDEVRRSQTMPLTLVAEPENSETGTRRRELARRVMERFAAELANSRLLCFLDDQDAPIIRLDRGPANRGFYAPINDGTPLDWIPEYVSSRIYVDDGVSVFYTRVVDGLIYLHGTACVEEVGLVMTLAHELQHAVQHTKSRKLWALNSLVNELDRAIIKRLNLTWADIPIEVDARLVSKRVAEQLFGNERVRSYIDGKIAEHVTGADAADWIYLRSLDPATTVDLAVASQLLFARLKDYRPELEAVLRRAKSVSQSYGDISLDSFFSATEEQKGQTA